MYPLSAIQVTESRMTRESHIPFMMDMRNQNLIRKYYEKRQLWRERHGRKNNIKMELRETGSEIVNRTELDHDMVE
jgi:hypothetical protein